MVYHAPMVVDLTSKNPASTRRVCRDQIFWIAWIELFQRTEIRDGRSESFPLSLSQQAPMMGSFNESLKPWN